MIYPQLLLDLHDELIVDLFAGGGGASIGIEQATGRQVDIAINHDEDAVEMHKANHPQTRHLKSDVFEVCPLEVTEGRPVGLLWASPDCTFHSKARGSKPLRSRETRRRALAWVVTRWAGQVQPRVIILENVEEFVDWGPLVGQPDKLRPDPRRKGQTFRHWVRSLEGHGYRVEWRELRACDFGAPTIRKRLFVIARRDGEPIVWPEPTYGSPKHPAVTRRKLKPYRTAADCIDWSLPIPSIFLTKEEAKEWGRQHGRPSPKRPLADPTLRRVARGVVRYVVENPNPFIVLLTHQGDRRTHPIDDQVPTVTAARRGELAIVSPTLIQTGYGERFGQAPRSLDLHAPLGTTVDGQKHALVAAHLSTYYGETRDGDFRAADMDDPLRTQTTANRHALIAAHIQRDFGQSTGHPANEPLGTIIGSGNGKAALVSAFLAQNNAGYYEGHGRPIDVPAATVLSTGSHQSLVAATMAKLRGTSSNALVDDPLHTISAAGQHHGLIAAHLTHNYTSNTGGGEGDLERPIKTLVTRPHAALVAAFLLKYYGTAIGQNPGDPMHTVPTVDRFGLVAVTINGESFVIVDIGLRMLQPHELYLANGCPPGYIIGRGADGRRFTKTVMVRMCGNMVCPPIAKVLVHANVPEMIARSEAA